MIYGSVCSGIEAASVAWRMLGWKPAFFAETEKFPSAVLANRFPNVPNLNNITKFKEWKNDQSINLLVGGTPCQSFSLAGNREGMDDPRGNLTKTFIEIAGKYRPDWLVWENVPGILSSNRGRDFGAFLGALAQCGYGFAYRILDAQYFGVPQRRRRVYLVGHPDWRRAAAVLFERESLCGNPAPSQKPEKEIAATVTTGFGTRLQEDDTYIVVNGRQDPVISANAQTLSNQSAGNDNVFVDRSSVRRMTARECERLQGFPDDWTKISWRGKPAEECPDGLRYKAIGNSMAVPVMRWIGSRIDLINKNGD